MCVHANSELKGGFCFEVQISSHKYHSCVIVDVEGIANTDRAISDLKHKLPIGALCMYNTFSSC